MATLLRKLAIVAWLMAIWSAPALAAGDAVPEADEAVIALGEKVYREQRCRVCHSIDGRGGRHPLDGVGSRLDRKTIRLWIVSPKQVDPKVRKRAYDGLPSDELEALVAYMQSLK